MLNRDTDSIGKLPADAVLLIPIGTPLPSDLADIRLVTGSLYQRLEPLANPSDSWVIIPIETMELHDLAQTWERLCSALHVFHLTGLPGASSDNLFEHVALTLAIRPAHWADVSAEMIEAVKTAQRSNAAPPPLGDPELPPPPETPRQPFSASARPPVRLAPPPVDSGDEE